MTIHSYLQNLLEQIPLLAVLAYIISTIINKKIDDLKTELSFKNQHKQTVKNHELNALFEYDTVLSKWVISLFTFNPHSVQSIGNYRQISSRLENIKNIRNGLSFLDSSVEVFISDENFSGIKDKLFKNVIRYEKILENEISGLMELYESYDTEDTYHASTNELAYEAILESISSDVKKFKERFILEHEQFRKECKAEFKKYKTSLNKVINFI